MTSAAGNDYLGVQSGEAIFADRREAGQLLAERLTHYRGKPGVIVVGLPRGGLPVAEAIARDLHAPLDVLLVRKLGTPGERELAFGAISTGGVRVLDWDLIESLGLSQAVIERTTAEERRELDARNRLYRENRPAPDLHGKTVIVVDDGVATGSTMRAALQALRSQNPARVILAAPVASVQATSLLRPLVDEIVILAQPEPFYAVGLWYRDFSQVSDAEVRQILASA